MVMKLSQSKKYYVAALLCALVGCSEENVQVEEVIRDLENCGNGALDAAEICDGTLFRTTDAVCSDGTAADKKLITCSSKCTLDLSKACVGSGQEEVKDPKCGNGKLDEGEVCDGGLFADGVRVCSSEQATFDHPVFRCTSDCKLDTSLACDDNPCGNGVINEGEQCDGKNYDKTAVSKISCGKGKQLVESYLTCTEACQIDYSGACVSDKFVLFSELIPALEVTTDSLALNGFAFELTNMGTSSVDASDCALYMVNADATSELVWKLADYGVNSFEPRDPTVICILNEGKDSFPGACDYTIKVEDFISLYKGKTLFSLTCGGEFVDMLNLNSITSAINGYGVDFIRHCDALPVTEVANALLGVGWTIDPESDAGPNYGLGAHCNADLALSSCTYTASRTTLTDRSQSIELAFEIKIPGLTDKTTKTDVTNDIKIEFVSGKLSQDKTTVNHEIHHRPVVRPDKEWSNDAGIDRYVAVQRNWDMYESYWSSEDGTYVLDAGISFDNGEHWTYCGPKGVISNVESYNAENRNTLTVSYEAGTCGDGVIQAAEVCDGTEFIEQVLVCSAENMVPVNMSKAKCQTSCDSYNIEAACAEVPVTCGNAQLDSSNGELCDGELFDEEAIAAKCDKEHFYVSGRLSCDKACVPSYSASCILSGFDLAINEFVVKMDESSHAPLAMAFSVSNLGASTVDGNACNFWIMDSSNKTMNTYSLASIIAGSDDGSDAAVINSCDSVVICSEPYKANEEDYIFPSSMCDARLFVANADSTYSDLIDLSEKIAKLQFSCSGEYVDTFDFSGLKAAIAEGYTHGKLVDDHSWPEASTSVLSRRMNLDKTFDLESFGSAVCK